LRYVEDFKRPGNYTTQVSDVLRTVELTPDPAEPPELHPVNTNTEDTEVIEDKEDARQQINFAFLSPE